MYVENPSEWGTKRTCGSCAAKFYDLRRRPAVCPKCQTEFVEPPKAKSRSSGATSGPARARNAATPFGHGQSPWAQRQGSHSPFTRAEGKVPDDGGVEDDVTEEKDVDATASDSEDGKSR